MSTSATRARRVQGGAAAPREMEDPVIYDHPIQDKARIASILGLPLGAANPVDDHMVRSLVGALPHDDVAISTQRYMARNGEIVNEAQITLTGQDYTAERLLTRDATGRAVMTNQDLEVSSGSRDKGIGTQLFARQVKALSALGVDRIETMAGGEGINTLEKHLGMMGYYVWPLLGYDGPIPSQVTNSFATPDAIRALNTVREIMRLPHVTDSRLGEMSGREWWRRLGVPFEGSFDLTPGSESMQTLRAYLDAKGIDWNTL